jgi:hypothetical protein
VFLNNLVYNNKIDWGYNSSSTIQAAGMKVSGTVVASPVFVARVGGDYHLAPGSPGIDQGTASGAPDHDLDALARPAGAAVDIGCYERHP